MLLKLQRNKHTPQALDTLPRRRLAATQLCTPALRLEEMIDRTESRFLRHFFTVYPHASTIWYNLLPTKALHARILTHHSQRHRRLSLQDHATQAKRNKLPQPYNPCRRRHTQVRVNSNLRKSALPPLCYLGCKISGSSVQASFPYDYFLFSDLLQVFQALHGTSAAFTLFTAFYALSFFIRHRFQAPRQKKVYEDVHSAKERGIKTMSFYGIPTFNSLHYTCQYNCNSEKF